MALKRYSKKEPEIFVWVLLPYAIFLNILAFGSCAFLTTPNFFKTFFSSAVYFLFIYFFVGTIARLIQNRFPLSGDMFKRIAIMLPVFYLLNAMGIGVFFYLHSRFSIVPCPIKQDMLMWVIFYGCIMATVITFINEGVANWEAWKTSITETEKLQNAYRRSKVLGLKGQINPHFLFNCFNTLSGLIQEDDEKAEKFLNEMTKVHRYLLRSDDELFVPLAAELKFSESYLYLAKERFADAITSTINVPGDMLQKQLPPLSMQAILENIIYTNALNKSDPLEITITSVNDNELAIINTIHEKTVLQNYKIDDGLDNLLYKYRMLNAAEITINETNNVRTILLPLFNKKEDIG